MARVVDIEDAAALHSHAFQSKAEIDDIRSSLLVWYRASRRRLPWRGNGPIASKGSDSSTSGSSDGISTTTPVTPYGTWVSEIMLQQTRVDAVISHYNAWMAKFPTVEALAAADPEEVSALWAGLGYYRRARMLHAGAKQVVSECGGVLPSTVDKLKKIPGIGDYTAGAIASIAYDQPAPLVDGNVIRVFSRLRAIAADAKGKSLAKHCWEQARVLLDPSSPGDFNQALMELGATVCTPKSPSCATCPVTSHCKAAALAGLTKLPVATPSQSLGPVPSGPEVITIVDSSEEEDDDVISLPASSTTAAVGSGDRASEAVACPLCEDRDGFDPKIPANYPLKTIKKAVRQETVVAVNILSTSDTGAALVLLVKRGADQGVLAGQWAPPHAVLPTAAADDESEEDSGGSGADEPTQAPSTGSAGHPPAAIAIAVGLVAALGLPASTYSVTSSGTASHAFSHIHHTVLVFSVRLSSPIPVKDASAVWQPLAAASDTGLSTWACKILSKSLSSDGPAGEVSYIRQRAGLKLKGEKIDGGERDEGGGTGGGGKRKAAADGEGGKGRKKGEGKQLPSTTKESPASSKVQKTMSAFFGKG